MIIVLMIFESIGNNYWHRGQNKHKSWYMRMLIDIFINKLKFDSLLKFSCPFILNIVHCAHEADIYHSDSKLC